MRGQRRVVGERRLAVDHRGEPGGVGRDHLVLGQAALEAQARHAEVRVLIGELEIARVVRRLGDAPGQVRAPRRSSICRLTMSRLVCASRLPPGARSTRSGIRYSNIEPDQDTSAAPAPMGVTVRPSRNQCRAGMSPLAMAMKLASRASEASRS